MLRRAFYFPIVLLAGLISGCATVPAPAILTIELYDSHAAAAKAAARPQADLPMPAAPTETPIAEGENAAPSIASGRSVDSAASGAAEAVAAANATPASANTSSPAASTGNTAQVVLGVPLLPEPRAAVPVDVGFLTPARPRSSSAFALAAPVAPAAAAVKAAAVPPPSSTRPSPAQQGASSAGATSRAGSSSIPTLPGHESSNDAEWQGRCFIG
jgi:hypothetical protein